MASGYGYGYGWSPFSGPMNAMNQGGCVCPSCGFGLSPAQSLSGYPGWNPGFAPGDAFGLGGIRTWGGTYSSQYTGTGLPTDEEIAEMIYDALDMDPLVPYDADIDVSVDSGEVTLAGTVPNKRVKHAIGDDSWWIPSVTDVHNELQLSGRRRSRSAPKDTQQQSR
jgi:hypothetical protein